jgi:hypothetical protein
MGTPCAHKSKGNKQQQQLEERNANLEENEPSRAEEGRRSAVKRAHAWNTCRPQPALYIGWCAFRTFSDLSVPVICIQLLLLAVISITIVLAEYWVPSC